MDAGKLLRKQAVARHDEEDARLAKQHHQHHRRQGEEGGKADEIADLLIADAAEHMGERLSRADERSEEHTSELQSLMRISYAVFCLKKKKNSKNDKKLSQLQPTTLNNTERTNTNKIINSNMT